jgi:pantothenate kinase
LIVQWANKRRARGVRVFKTTYFSAFNIAISPALLFAISDSIGQFAHLQSKKQAHIYISDSFIRRHGQTLDTLSYAIKFRSEGKRKPYPLGTRLSRRRCGISETAADGLGEKK